MAGAEESQGAPARQRAWLMGAVAAAGGATLLGMLTGPLFGGFFLLTGVPAATPLLLLWHARGCARLCLVIGTALLIWGVVAFQILMFLFLPAALLFLTAAFVQPGSRPGAVWTVVTPLAVTAVFAWALL
ncbi:hypothetical protein ACIQRS_09120 [Streptomyces termitum]|uniref:Uncharacterized protein n=1 Tax=Streptomyces termitum TaxID=67368 RepID=A0A918W240_9ACTN|nr:hypothetical protein [Streptomyces termitum]GHA63651.1 hypothetical protein GCM10010305_01310 [Streptomyces termitum]